MARNMGNYLDQTVHARAFSLIEMLATLTLLAIMLFLASPLWRPLLQANLHQAQADKIIVALEYTRIFAITQSKNISFCRRWLRGDPKDWSAGQIIKDESSGTVVRYVDALASKTAAVAQNTLIWRSSFSKNDCITFAGDGTPYGQQGSFYYCHARNDGGRNNFAALRIVLQGSGHIHAEKIEGQEARDGCALQ
jgi:type IV fimbrial biogenesis protein FimT